MSKTNYERYEEKLVAYIDILGWKDATSNPEEISLDVRNALKIMDAAKIISNGIEIGFFSDGMLITISPESDGIHRILSIGNICRKLLAIGFLCRGAIAKGACFHQENRVFGPAINKVVDLEKKEAKSPRILLDNTVPLDDTISPPNIVYLKADFVSYDPKDGQAILNLFPDICGLKDVKSLQIEEIREKINEKIKEYSEQSKQCHVCSEPTEMERKREKWLDAKKIFEIQTSNFTL